MGGGRGGELERKANKETERGRCQQRGSPHEDDRGSIESKKHVRKEWRLRTHTQRGEIAEDGRKLRTETKHKRQRKIKRGHSTVSRVVRARTFNQHQRVTPTAVTTLTHAALKAWAMRASCPEEAKSPDNLAPAKKKQHTLRSHRRSARPFVHYIYQVPGIYKTLPGIYYGVIVFISALHK